MATSCTLLICVVIFGVSGVTAKIVDLSIDKQHWMLSEARLKCKLKMNSDPYPKTGVYCNRTWDTILCWPDVPAGSTSIQSCPDYVNRFDTESYATKRCMEDGTWFYSSKFNQSWTNYTACGSNATLKSDKYKIIAVHMPYIRIMLNIGYSVSLVCLVVSVALMTYLRKLHCPRNCVHINLFVSFILRACASLVREHLIIGGMGFRNDVYQEEDSTWLLIPGRTNWECKLFFTIFHYCLGANYMWILMEGLYLHMLIFVSVFSEKSSVRVYMIAGWLMPFIWVIPWAIVRLYLLDVYCWNTLENKHYNWIMRAPITLTIVINFFCFVNIIRVLFTKLKTQNTPEARKFRYRKLAKSTLVLIPLFGVHYIIFLGFPDKSEDVPVVAELVRMYFEMFFNSFQGFMVSIMFCFLNGEVQAEILKKWHRYKLRRFGGGGSQKTATSMSTYLSKARNSLHSIHSLVNDRKDSIQKNGDSPPDRNGNKSNVSSSGKQSNGHTGSLKSNNSTIKGEGSPKLVNGGSRLVCNAIVEEDISAGICGSASAFANNEPRTIRRDSGNSSIKDDDVLSETTAMLHMNPRKEEVTGGESKELCDIISAIKSESYMLDEMGDSAKRLLTDEEILSEDLV